MENAKVLCEKSLAELLSDPLYQVLLQDHESKWLHDDTLRDLMNFS
jgi:hypothetical protein